MRHRMQMRYGLSEDNLWRECVSANEVTLRVQSAGAQIVRFSIEDDCAAPQSWQHFETYIEGVLAAGALPMVTFSKFERPYGDVAAIRWFAEAASGLVRRSIERWGSEAVRKWFWCLGNEPNSDWRNAGLTFELYRRLYEAAASSVVACLAPYLEGQKARVGGPGIDSFQPFWMDWVYRFVHEIDNQLTGFVLWHRYGDWRERGEWGAPPHETTFRALLMSRAAEYEMPARAVGRMLKGRGILNICGDLNAHSHYDPRISDPLNRTGFGLAYYGSALIHLLRGGVDVEMLHWARAANTPQYFAKQLCARFVRDGDELQFPEFTEARGRLDAVQASGSDGRWSLLLVHLRDEPFTLSAQEAPTLEQCSRVFRIDARTEGEVVETRFDGELSLEGYGIAVITGPEAERQ